jgi:beta-aspartyl-dipeptidase (metallo-type)
MILLKKIKVYAPEYLGEKDVLTGGGRVLRIADELDMPDGALDDVIDGKGLIVIPGLIDAHVHIAGAGGEGGPATRTPEMQLSHMLEAGVTTVIGCLGTDGMTRSLESVLMKVKALRQEGVSAWMLTGAYQVPVPTLTGDVGRDIALFEEVIGVGEVAIADHRSSKPSAAELARIAQHARVGAMLGNKSGVVNIHMGDEKDPFRLLYRVQEEYGIPLKQFWPTHCNRNSYIFEDAKNYGKQGYIDLTASSYPFFPDDEVKPSKAIRELLQAGVPLSHITLTSDACGSLPSFDDEGKLLKLEMGYPYSVFSELKDAILREETDIATAVSLATSNVADILKLHGKGRIREGYDADLLILDPDFNMIHLMAMGNLMVKTGRIVKRGAYEK